MDTFEKILNDARAIVDRIVRERDEAQVEAERLARENGALCDAIAEADKRIRQLEAVLVRVALWEQVSPMTARAALLGMDDADGPAVAEAWERSRWVTADTEAA